MKDPITTGVRGVPRRPIHERQLDEDMLCLQRAAPASHERGQLVEAVRVFAAVILAVAGIVSTLVGHGRPALLQEKFDATLFHLPWRSTVAGEPIADPDVYRLARKLQPGSAKDQRITSGWYDPTSGVHHPYDVLIAQEQNLAWDARLRRQPRCPRGGHRMERARACDQAGRRRCHRVGDAAQLLRPLAGGLPDRHRDLGRATAGTEAVRFGLERVAVFGRERVFSGAARAPIRPLWTFQIWSPRSTKDKRRRSAAC
jgi:hypothetical protein